MSQVQSVLYWTFDGTRWWILTIYWQEETPSNPFPRNSFRIPTDVPVPCQLRKT